MDKGQAAEIQRHLLDAADAVDRASVVLVGLSREDRATFAAPFDGALASAVPKRDESSPLHESLSLPYSRLITNLLPTIKR
jgi:hypothetical protein